MDTGASTTAKASSLRWKILRQALLRKPADDQSAIGVKRITRKTSQGFNLIPSNLVQDPTNLTDATVCYTLPIDSAPKLYINQRVVDRAELSDFEICNQYNIDNTGLVCQWPSEEALAYFCLQNADMFRSKRVIELGAGYGLAGLVIAAVTEASEVVITDGNPQVVDYIQRNIDANSKAFDGTRVTSMMLHWNQTETSDISSTFDLIVASDCTFFKEFHNGLAHIVKFVLEKVQPSEAIFFSPKRGDSLDKFLEKIKEVPGPATKKITAIPYWSGFHYDPPHIPSSAEHTSGRIYLRPRKNPSELPCIFSCFGSWPGQDDLVGDLYTHF